MPLTSRQSHRVPPVLGQSAVLNLPRERVNPGVQGLDLVIVHLPLGTHGRGKPYKEFSEGSTAGSRRGTGEAIKIGADV